MYLLNNSCAQENDSLCEDNCDNESVIEVITDQKAMVIEHSYSGIFLSINPADFDREFYVPSNEFILVPCNWNYSYKPNAMVVISGKKKSCCNLIAAPQVWGEYGCKFEITSIEHLTD